MREMSNHEECGQFCTPNTCKERDEGTVDLDYTITPQEVRARLDKSALDAIRDLMSGAEWDSDTTEAVARIVQQTGREILQPDEVEDDSLEGGW